MKSLLLRNLFFTILQPGVVTILIPYFLVQKQISILTELPSSAGQWVAVIAFATGFFILIHCVYRFATEGNGTISPIDPTQQLVTSGLYRYSRNPMYLGVMLMLIGEALFFRSGVLWIYAAVIFAAFMVLLSCMKSHVFKGYSVINTGITACACADGCNRSLYKP